MSLVRLTPTGHTEDVKDKQSEASEKDVGCVILKKSTSPEERRGAEVQLSRSGPIARVVTMWSFPVWLCLVLLLPWCAQCQRGGSAGASPDQGMQTDTLAVDIVNRSGMLIGLFPPEFHPVLRQGRAPPRPASQLPKRAQQGSRFALSLDVPTSILSVLIDLAKNQDMRTKAAANAELMARIG
ncbi:unnamed protein product [Arctogadus glacialis]